MLVDLITFLVLAASAVVVGYLLHLATGRLWRRILPDAPPEAGPPTEQSAAQPQGGPRELDPLGGGTSREGRSPGPRGRAVSIHNLLFLTPTDFEKYRFDTRRAVLDSIRGNPALISGDLRKTIPGLVGALNGILRFPTTEPWTVAVPAARWGSRMKLEHNAGLSDQSLMHYWDRAEACHNAVAYGRFDTAGLNQAGLKWGHLPSPRGGGSEAGTHPQTSPLL